MMTSQHRIYGSARPIWTWLTGICLLLPAAAARAETVIETESRGFTIIDDGDRLDAQLVDDLPLDTYVYHPGGERKNIVVVTDRGEHRFVFKRGETIDFKMRHRGRLFPQRFAPVEAHDWDGPDSLTLPFELGPNNAILVQGSINGSRPIMLLFDTGASISVVNSATGAKGAKLLGPTGEIRLGDLKVRNTPIIAINYKESLKADGVLGYNVFLGRQVTIDYGRRELRIGVPVDQPPPGFRTLPLIWRGGHSLVTVGIDDGQSLRQLPMVLDTGSKYALSLSNQDPLANQSSRLATFGWRIGSKSDGRRVFSRVFTLPAASLAGFSMPNVQADVERPSRDSTLGVDILGNDFLKRFDLIIDYQSGQLHVKPNQLASTPYNSVGLSDRMLIAIGALIVLLFAWALTKILRRRALKKSHLV